MTDRPILSRRSFLAALGLTGAAALLAGCGGSPVSSSSEAPASSAASSQVEPEPFLTPGWTAAPPASP